jgi:Flp pilus assembly protein TadD
MIVALLIALSPVAEAQPAVPPSPEVQLKEAREAAAAGRLDQARLFIANAIAAGARPVDADRAIGDLAFDSANYAEALGVYQKLLAIAPDDPVILERAGIAAIQVGNIAVAAQVIGRATAKSGASWRAWNARGVIADMKGDWASADAAYDKAERLAPGHFEVINNRGWTRLLRGDWQGAVELLQRAAAIDPKSVRMANNLELARTALSTDLPSRNPGESDRDWAARLNDAGMTAQLLGDRKRAIAAFTQALEASGSWYERAANNLQAASAQ